jgi:hypothetical protein
MTEVRDYRDYRKRKLSGSVDGRGIGVNATSTPGTLIHQALSNSAASEWDEVWLRAINTTASSATVTIEWGGTTSGDLLTFTLPANEGLVELIPGHLLQNGREVRAFSSVSNGVTLHGFVNRYENT